MLNNENVAHAQGDTLPDLRGRVALVTGGTRNIGLEIAQRFAAAGADVAVFGNRDEEALESTGAIIEASGRRFFGILADVSDPASLLAAASSVREALGPVDILVNNASIRPHARLGEVSVEEWDSVLAVNLRAPFLLSQELLPAMLERGWGRIVNMGGLSAWQGKQSRPHVMASKAGLEGLTRAMATEASASEVTVNCIVPGHIDTGRGTPEERAERRRRIDVSRIPMARMGTPSEVAAVCLFLTSGSASYVTGQTLFVSGGSHPMVR